MEDMQLYDMALKSIKRYKESGEILADFDDFIEETAKEYREIPKPNESDNISST